MVGTAPAATPTLPPTVAQLLQHDLNLCFANATCTQILARGLNACVQDALCEPALIAFFKANPNIFIAFLNDVAGKASFSDFSITIAHLAGDPTLGTIIRTLWDGPR